MFVFATTTAVSSSHCQHHPNPIFIFGGLSSTNIWNDKMPLCTSSFFFEKNENFFFSQSDTSLSSTIESNSERAVGLYRMQFLSNDSSRIPSISIGLQRASGDLLELQQLGDRSRRPCRPPGAARWTRRADTWRLGCLIEWWPCCTL